MSHGTFNLRCATRRDAIAMAHAIVSAFLPGELYDLSITECAPDIIDVSGMATPENVVGLWTARVEWQMR